ncbi:MAG: phosphoglycerate kinase [Candidatus Liptonbacteria bacterium RIFCSPLOWO2_01_FULL_56_20]|uniref:Phosphoglycerate kinase n=1 Tax=Candidatus Liptonbacteria bacterium RIFCSPLOWO2_01_FULL_56_20 TaxID=1798652 RepID=A0A1G2CMB1_9BACT|nr:MAG: phosphoglycerate kinase [Candidatus Liptonbacteria bacterium RIFCSPHIGHO2_01_FULL_56_18b]OGZ01781.1 MAG: phosphoglycerate kinase [Candidatus Liptonbacteria bacterium RIFCSPLOWO2_01_FULL_56_20]
MRYVSKENSRALHGTALLRLDFNTEDEWRMTATLPTIKLLLRRGATVVIVSHRGRPSGVKIAGGQPVKFEKKLSLKRDAMRLARLLRRKIRFIPHFRFKEIRRKTAQAPRGSVFLLENLRFLRGEDANDPRLARELASLADFYVNDAFAVSHRDDASVDAITKFLPSYGGMGFEREIRFLSHALTQPKHPLVIILGGGKAHDKLGVLRYFRAKADWFLLGGAAANTLHFVRGMNVGRSLIDRERSDLKMLKAVSRYENLILPSDWITRRNAILDIGPRTIREFEKRIRQARTIIWSGPLGLAEEPRFAKGSLAVAWAIAANRRAFSIAGGGETVMFLKKYRLDKKFSFISTGGGAMLDFLAGEKLPGISALHRTRAARGKKR